jgi:hypothetical protein
VIISYIEFHPNKIITIDSVGINLFKTALSKFWSGKERKRAIGFPAGPVRHFDYITHILSENTSRETDRQTIVEAKTRIL